MTRPLFQAPPPSPTTHLDEFWLLVEVRRSEGREGDPLQFGEQPTRVQHVAEATEQLELVQDRDLFEDGGTDGKSKSFEEKSRI